MGAFENYRPHHYYCMDENDLIKILEWRYFEDIIF